MNKFNWSKATGFGVLTWVIMFVLASIVVAFGATLAAGWGYVLAVVAGVVAYSFAINADSANVGQAFGYGLTFAVIGIVLDMLISARFQSGIFSMATYWVGYALVFFAPWVEYEMQGAGAHPKAI
jgi:FtsH-binding integral membrane protein